MPIQIYWHAHIVAHSCRKRSDDNSGVLQHLRRQFGVLSMRAVKQFHLRIVVHSPDAAASRAVEAIWWPPHTHTALQSSEGCRAPQVIAVSERVQISTGPDAFNARQNCVEVAV